MAVQKLAVAAGDQLAELDLNPILVRTKGVAVVDSLIVTDQDHCRRGG